MSPLRSVASTPTTPDRCIIRRNVLSSVEDHAKLKYKMKRYHLVMLLLLTVAVAAAGQSGQFEYAATPESGQTAEKARRAIDSIRQILPGMTDEERLTQYYKMYLSAERLPDNGVERDRIVEEYIAEAKKAGDVEHAVMAMNIQLSKAGEDFLAEHTEEYARYAKEKGQWDYYYKMYSPLISEYIYSDRVAEAVDISRMLYEEARDAGHTFGVALAAYNLGLAYDMLFRMEEAKVFMQESFGLFRGLLSEDVSNTDYLNAGEYLVALMVEFEECREAIRILDEMAAEMERYEKLMKMGKADSPLSYIWIKVYIRYGDAWMYLREFDRARRYFDMAQELSSSLPIRTYDEWVWESRLNLAQLEGDYEGALTLLDNMPSGLVETDNASAGAAMMQLKASILLSGGRYRESAELYKRLLPAVDSLRNVEFSAQLDEMRTIYEVDKITAEKERTRILLLWALFAVVMLAIVLVIWIVYSRRLGIKNKGLVKLIQEQGRIKEAQRQERLSPSGRTTVREHVSPETELFNRLETYLLETGTYLDPGFDRQRLPAELGTNTTYLYNAVKAIAGQTLQEYINSLRLDAAKQLLESDAGLTIEAVALDCGFNTPRTFYRQFREAYNMSPREYRNGLPAA